MNATTTKRRGSWPRLALMVTLLLMAVGATLYAQAQPAPPGSDRVPAPAQAPGGNPANSPVSIPGNVPGNTPAAVPGQAAPPTPLPERVTPPAQTSAASETAGPASGGAPIQLSDQPLYRVKQLFMFSPVINGIILALSVLGLLFFCVFMLSINRRTMVPTGFVDEVVKLVIRGDYERAGDVCRRARGVFAAGIVQRCVENASQTHSVMLDMIDTEGRRQADIIWNRVSYLADISNVAPMLGLLGTVLGMIKAFYGLQHETGTIDALTLSRGVGEAMSTTLFGLSVGIITLVMYSLVKSRATRTLAEAEQAVHMIADHIKRDDSAIPSR